MAPTRDIQDLAAGTAETLHRIAEAAPRVHCLTNSVAQPITANALLAIGAVPSMTADLVEMPEMVRSASALLINLGTPGKESAAIHDKAVAAATQAHLPWVLDPVMADRSVSRGERAKALLSQGPTALRCNGGEATFLSEEIAAQPMLLSAVTGAVDVVRSAYKSAELRTGHALATRVTAAGCALSALVAAALAVRKESAFDGALHALAAFGAAGSIAGHSAQGPGSFATALLDALYTLSEAQIAESIQTYREAL